MNSSLHQWAAEISTNQSKTILTAVEGSVCAALALCSWVCVYVCVVREREREYMFGQQLFHHEHQIGFDQPKDCTYVCVYT